jgi:hypothetical protein
MTQKMNGSRVQAIRHLQPECLLVVCKLATRHITESLALMFSVANIFLDKQTADSIIR